MATTLSDIARHAEVATSTVADVLRGRSGYSAKTRARILEVAAQLNFVPNHAARSLQQKRSFTIGIAGSLRSTSVTGAMLKAMSEGLLKKGYMPLFCESSKQGGGEERAVRELRGRTVDGVILSGGGDDADLLRILPKDIPCVVIRSANTLDIPCVASDHGRAFEHGVQWLAERGHRRIAFMGVGNVQAMRYRLNTHRLKIEGYRAAMERLGLFDETLLLDSDWQPGETRRFVARHGELFKTITAVLACNDRVAIEVMSGLADLGLRVPEDCSLIGFDGTEFGLAVRPTLTTFEPRLAEIGVKAVEMILDLIAGREVQPVAVVPELVERESVRTLG